MKRKLKYWLLGIKPPYNWVSPHYPTLVARWSLIALVLSVGITLIVKN